MINESNLANLKRLAVHLLIREFVSSEKDLNSEEIDFKKLLFNKQKQFYFYAHKSLEVSLNTLKNVYRCERSSFKRRSCRNVTFCFACYWRHVQKMFYIIYFQDHVLRGELFKLQAFEFCRELDLFDLPDSSGVMRKIRCGKKYLNYVYRSSPFPVETLNSPDILISSIFKQRTTFNKLQKNIAPLGIWSKARPVLLENQTEFVLETRALIVCSPTMFPYQYPKILNSALSKGSLSLLGCGDCFEQLSFIMHSFLFDTKIYDYPPFVHLYVAASKNKHRTSFIRYSGIFRK